MCGQSCLTLCDIMDCSLLGSSTHGISQTRRQEWVAISFSRGSSQLRDWTHFSAHWQVDSFPLSHLGSPFFGEGETVLHLQNNSGNVHQKFSRYFREELQQRIWGKACFPHPLRPHGVLLSYNFTNIKDSSAPKWYHSQYWEISFYYFPCGSCLY